MGGVMRSGWYGRGAIGGYCRRVYWPLRRRLMGRDAGWICVRRGSVVAVRLVGDRSQHQRGSLWSGLVRGQFAWGGWRLRQGCPEVVALGGVFLYRYRCGPRCGGV